MERSGKTATRSSGPKFRANSVVMALVVIAMLAGAGYFAYAWMINGGRTDAEDAKKNVPQKIVQVDVLNGCGAAGVGAKCTSYLRGKGFDVVEFKNFTTFSVHQTLVVDRTGDLATARRVAAVLGVAEEHVIQQLSRDYFVDVSVIIGSDYKGLRLEN